MALTLARVGLKPDLQAVACPGSGFTHLFSTAAANRSNTPTDVVQSMQPSVMLWP